MNKKHKASKEEEVKQDLKDQEIGTENHQDKTQPESAEKTTAESSQSEGNNKTSVEDEKKAASEEMTDKAPEPSAEDKLKEMHRKYLLLAADFDNYRKRMLKEKADFYKYAGEDIFNDLLPVIDDMERALASCEQSNDISAIKEGLTLIFNKFNEFLKNRGLTVIESKEKPFNTDFHEAITKIPAPSEELKGKVVDVIQKGYMYKDKILRYSKVVVGE
jgi:molecular chaperone GrpE